MTLNTRFLTTAVALTVITAGAGTVLAMGTMDHHVMTASSAKMPMNMSAGAFMAKSLGASTTFDDAVTMAQQQYDKRVAAGETVYAAGDRFNQDVNAARDAFNKSVNEAQSTFNQSAYAAPTDTHAGSNMMSHTFRSHLQASNQVPPVDSPAYGEYTAMHTEGSNTLSMELTGYNIDKVTMAHLHLGAAGTSGPVVLPIMLMPVGNGTVNGVLSKGDATQAQLTGSLMGKTIEDLIKDIKDGMIYVNVHTADYPGGEMRGQVSMQ